MTSICFHSSSKSGNVLVWNNIYMCGRIKFPHSLVLKMTSFWHTLFLFLILIIACPTPFIWISAGQMSSKHRHFDSMWISLIIINKLLQSTQDVIVCVIRNNLVFNTNYCVKSFNVKYIVCCVMWCHYC